MVEDTAFKAANNDMPPNKTARTIESYDKNAQKFETKFLNFAPYREKNQFIPDKYLGNGKTTILVVGCGLGNHSRYL